jgi:hypothetical protein
MIQYVEKQQQKVMWVQDLRNNDIWRSDIFTEHSIEVCHHFLSEYNVYDIAALKF